MEAYAPCRPAQGDERRKARGRGTLSYGKGEPLSSSLLQNVLIRSAAFKEWGGAVVSPYRLIFPQRGFPDAGSAVLFAAAWAGVSKKGLNRGPPRFFMGHRTLPSKMRAVLQ